MRTCYVCQKEIKPNDLGHRPFVHIRCRAGTVKWCEWFKALPKAKRSTIGQIIYDHSLTKGVQRETE